MAKDIFIVIIIVGLITIIYNVFLNNPKLNTVTVDLNNNKYDLEVAKTIPQKTKGLMNRPTLGVNSGMIFVSDFDIPQGFWMKNTLIPLDMIFVDSQGKIVSISTATPQPGATDNQLVIYKSEMPAKYVIELNAGISEKIKLRKGDVISLPKL